MPEMLQTLKLAAKDSKVAIMSVFKYTKENMVIIKRTDEKSQHK